MIDLGPLGDRGFLARFAAEDEARDWHRAVRDRNLPGVLDLVLAYDAVAVYADPDRTDLDELERALEQVDSSAVFNPRPLGERVAATPPGEESGTRLDVCALTPGPVRDRVLGPGADPSPGGVAATLSPKGRGFTVLSHTIGIVRIPVLYDGEDLDDVAQKTGLSRHAVIAAHSKQDYRVKAIGFLPGFPYCGDLAPELSGLARRSSPRTRVPAGSVAIVGRQTGIYPAESPGGWHLIGRTPLVIADLDTGFFPIHPGDLVLFEPIEFPEYRERLGERLGESSSGPKNLGRL